MELSYIFVSCCKQRKGNFFTLTRNLTNWKDWINSEWNNCWVDRDHWRQWLGWSSKRDRTVSCRDQTGEREKWIWHADEQSSRGQHFRSGCRAIIQVRERERVSQSATRKQILNVVIFGALLLRHGVGHTITPSAVNYRANIEALRLAGCTHILASTACGSLTESIGRGQLVIPDSFIDRTFHRKNTFYDASSVNYSGMYSHCFLVAIYRI